jgi:hypothetical protein
LKLNVSGHGRSTTFRLLADHMPALRELEAFIRGQPSQDGFIELVSRLRSLSVYASASPWDSGHNDGAWPLTLPNLEELTWRGDDRAVAVAVAVLRRAVSLRAAHVSHASALAAIAAGPVSGAGSCFEGSSVYAPLSHVQTLTLAPADNDPVGLFKILKASPCASAVRLRWDGFPPALWDFLHAVASEASGEERSGFRSVRRVRLDVYYSRVAPSTEAARCVRALFPRARHASWCTNGSHGVQLLSEVVV